jgi:hypothetical protein
MAYGTIKVDTITFTDAGVDKSVTISGLVQNPTFSGNITVTGTVSGNTIQGQTVSGATITGGAAAFTTVTGGVATITSGVFALGSVSNPSISFNGDANSGLYSPGADQVAVATNGARRLLISDGQIQADTLFSVAMGGAGFQTVFRNGANEDNYLTQGASGFTLFRNHNGSEYMRLDSSGRLGIGNSAPNESLHVNGAIRFTSNSPALAASDGGLVDWVAASGELRVTAARTGANSSKIGFITYNSGSLVQAATIDSSGRLLVGTSSSRSVVIGSSTGWSAQNQIASTSTNNIGLSLFSWSNYSTDVGGGAGVGPDIVLARSNSNTEGTQAAVTNGMLLGRINFNGSDGTAFANGAYISAASDGQTWASGDCPGRLVFSTTADGASSPTERMRIDSSGDLIKIGGVIKGERGTAAAPAYSFFDDTDTGIFNISNADLGFSVGGTERARIDSSGRLLVGTSTDTTAKLVVKGSAGSGDDGINVISGSTTAGSKAAIFFSPSSTGSSSTGSAIKTERLSPDGSDLQFYTCTALGSSPTERMRITSAGLVGINTTSPSGQLSVTFNGNSVQGIVATDTGTPGAGNYYLLCGSSGGIQNFASNEIHHSAVSALAFRTGAGNGTERARIDSSGRLLVGTSSGTSRLSIAGTADNANSEIQITATGIASGYIGANSNGLNIGTDTAGLVFKTGVTGGGSVGASGTERMRIDNSGRLLVGTSSARSNVYRGASSLISPVQIDSNANSYSNGINVLNYSGSGYGSVFTLGLSLSNTQGTNTVVRNNDELGYLNFVGNDGTNFRTGAWIGGEVDGTPGAGDMPGRLVFSTTADGAASPTERMRIGQNGLSYFFSSGSTVIYAGSSSAAGTTNNILQGGHSATSTTAALTSFVVHNNGNVLNTNNSYGSLSDIKLKENIVDASSQWDDLKDLKVRNYNFKEGQTHTQIGLVAQEVELVSPGLVSESPDRDEDGNDLGTVTKSVNYSVLYMKAVKALQEAMERIEQLEAKVAALETK